MSTISHGIHSCGGFSYLLKNASLPKRMRQGEPWSLVTRDLIPFLRQCTITAAPRPAPG